MQITLRPQGRVLAASADESVLDAALRAHVNLPHGCRGGNCGACRARLLAGEIRYPRGRPAGLADAEIARGEVLLCQARALGDLELEVREIRRVGEVESRCLPCRIERLERLAPDVIGAWLRLPAVEEFPFLPGQYLDVILRDGARRSYSIASPPHDARLLELHVRRVPGGEFSAALLESLTPGALLRIEGPLGSFAYADSDAPALLIGGGTGFAPLKSILRHVLETGRRRPLQLYWGVRAAVDLYADAWLRAQAAAHPFLHYVPVLSAAEPGDPPELRRGPVHEAVLADHESLAGCEVYAAGPPVLIETLRERLPARGLAPERLYFDSFEFAPRS